MYREYLIIILGIAHIHNIHHIHMYIHNLYYIHHIHMYIRIIIPSFLLLFVASWLPATLCVRYNCVIHRS